MFKITEKNRKIRFCRIHLNLSLLLLVAGSFLLSNFAISANISENNIIELTNNERIDNNLKALKKNPLLKKAAEQKAQDIIKSGIFSHTINSNSFSQWVKEAGYEYSFIGENLAIDFVSSEGTVQAWLQSPTHKENLLNERFEEIGVAVLEGKFENNNTILVVQIFGTPIIQTKEQPINENEKLLVSLKDDSLINKESNTVLAKTLKTPSHIQNNNTHPLVSSSKSGKFYSLIFAIIISSLIVSFMFPKGLTIKKINLKSKLYRLLTFHKTKYLKEIQNHTHKNC